MRRLNVPMERRLYLIIGANLTFFCLDRHYVYDDEKMNISTSVLAESADEDERETRCLTHVGCFDWGR